MTGERVRALRHARELVDDFRWRGLVVPGWYASRAEEFRAMVASGAYAAWLASPGTPRHRASRAAHGGRR